MAKKVTKIPATISLITSAPIVQKVKRKVAGYARVSTDNEEQLTSYDAQLDYYTKYIKGHEDWEFAGMYSDEGISGTSTKRRKGFQKMIEDALEGKIGLIITKSVSRFARNTVDSLTTIRKLKENGIEVYFEKENIWTLDAKGELLLTIMSSIAQEESRSISENVTWGQRKRIADGKVSVPFKHFLGYEKGEDGNLVVNEKEAAVVRQIYSDYLTGLSFHAIANRLTAQGIKTPGGKDKWSQGTVKSILTNEKYKGDALLQKYYTVDYLTKKQIPNDGKIPQYYVRDNHEAIIDAATFDKVQDEVKSRSREKRSSGVTIFSSKIKCGECGNWYGSKVWHSNDKNRRVIWQCNHKFKDKSHNCGTPHLTEDDIKEAFIKAVNVIITEKEVLVANLREGLKGKTDTGDLEAKRDELAEEMNIVAELMQKAITRNASIAQDQEEYNRNFNKLTKRLKKAEDELQRVDEEIKQKGIDYRRIMNFLETIEALPERFTEFDEALWSSLIDYATVYGKGDIRFTTTSGIEI